MPNKLFVGNISWDASQEEFQDLFAQYGDVQEAIIIYDRATGRSKGFGFVTFVNEEDARNAIAALNEYVFLGRNLKVNEALPPKPKPDYQ